MSKEYIQNVKANRIVYYNGNHSLSRDEILHHSRKRVENCFRWRLHLLATNYGFMYVPELARLNSSHKYLDPRGGREKEHGFWRDTAVTDFCNKTAPFYVFSEHAYGDGSIMSRCLQEWLFTQWFAPYRSEIDFGQFVVKFINTKGALPNDLTNCVNTIVELHHKVCVEAAEMIDTVSGWIYQEERHLWLIRPSFRAVVLVALHRDYPLFEEYIPYTPVLVLQTGNDQGLSAPISLDTIDGPENMSEIVGKDGRTRQVVQTILQKAYDFLFALEQREIAAFGHQPDPSQCINPTGGLAEPELRWRTFKHNHQDDGHKLETEARRLGWNGEFDVIAPSSRWVDGEKFPISLNGASDKLIKGQDDRHRHHLVMDVSRRGFLVKHFKSN